MFVRKTIRSLGYTQRELPNEFFEKLKITANSAAFIVRFPDLPLFGTTAFDNFRLPIFIFSWIVNQSFETFVYCIAHELTHIVLDAIRHPLMDNEIAVDLATMILGFSEVIKIGRMSGEFGYLNDNQFSLAYEEINKRKGIIYL